MTMHPAPAGASMPLFPHPAPAWPGALALALLSRVQPPHLTVRFPFATVGLKANNSQPSLELIFVNEE